MAASTGSSSAAENSCPKTKYILVTGGVISGIGKGVFSSSVGALLKACNIRVTTIKIDPYVNIDAGKMLYSMSISSLICLK